LNMPGAPSIPHAGARPKGALRTVPRLLFPFQAMNPCPSKHRVKTKYGSN
jgi:hypothetical protein